MIYVLKFAHRFHPWRQPVFNDPEAIAVVAFNGTPAAALYCCGALSNVDDILGRLKMVGPTIQGKRIVIHAQNDVDIKSHDLREVIVKKGFAELKGLKLLVFKGDFAINKVEERRFFIASKNRARSLNGQFCRIDVGNRFLAFIGCLSVDGQQDVAFDALFGAKLVFCPFAAVDKFFERLFQAIEYGWIGGKQPLNVDFNRKVEFLGSKRR